ncbi:Bardet-Biedl syndrome 7 protein-like isoform X2 [Plodia interpunctella]
MCVLGGDLTLCSGRTVTCYRDLRELHSYICEDRVLDVAAFAAPNSTRIRLLVLVANKGVEILDNGQLLAHAAISAGPSRLAVPPQLHISTVHAFYGAADGSIGYITYEGAKLTSKCLMEGRGLGTVICMGWFFNNAGSHLAVGRHDGSIQLYIVDMENLTEKPRLKFTYFCGEPVTSVCGGCVGSEESELLAATFSGRIFALRSQRLISGMSNLANIPAEALTARRAKLETEIARLEKQVTNEREKYQKNTRSLHSGLSTPPLLDIQYELFGATHDGWQEAQLTSAVPLDMLFIYCNRKLDLLTDSAAVLSVCSSQSQEIEKDLLATVRCQAGTRRLWVRIRYILQEGNKYKRSQAVRVLIYILPAGAPRVARLITLKLPVLPYYSQHEHLEIESEERSWCELRVSGSFSVAEITSWLTDALPSELPRPSNNVAFSRSHTLLKTVLIARYQRGLAVFKSDNVSTIAILKDIMSNCSVEKNIRVEISFDVPIDNCEKSFLGIKSLFESEYKMHKNMVLKKALSSLDLEGGSNEDIVLCEDYLHLLGNTKDSNKESHFDELVEMIEQWYVDWKSFTLQGYDHHSGRTKLKKALHDNNFEQIINIFSNKDLLVQ